LNWSDLASHFRLYNYFIKSGAAEDKIESFIDNISSSNLPPEKVIELVNELFNISKEENQTQHFQHFALVKLHSLLLQLVLSAVNLLPSSLSKYKILD
jgi:hypothetical protein